jgi:signal transduction histidine kinase
MRRLYLQLYLAFVGIVVLFAALSSALVVALPGDWERMEWAGVAQTAGELLPPAGAPRAELEAALERIGGRFGVDAALYAPTRERIAAFGPFPEQAPHRLENGWIRHFGPPAIALELPDGRWLLARSSGHSQRHAGWLLMLAALAAAIGIGAYPLARRLARRLERLQARVEALGAGDLAARVVVEGSDEVARLATSFNRAAERIEQLVGAQRRALASASHELRSPLARLRLALELLGEGRPELVQAAARDISELDELIGELLLASQLDAAARPAPLEPVDLLALAAEEGARVGADVGGDPAPFPGDARLLRRLVRNLLENARRHGGGTPIQVRVGARAGGAWLAVEDRGPGVPAEERERIFEPFYRPAGARESGQGAGLGLALVRQIAAHHGGHVRCVERPGGGSRFEVELPARA